jgi:superfamily II DNA or RNA helicase
VSNLVLNDALFAELAGWEAMKQARALVASDKVLASQWQPPLLRGTVQDGSASYPAGLVIRSASDAENLCPCRDSRQRGIICAHAVAVGLHYLKSLNPPATATQAKLAGPIPAKSMPAAKAKALRRAATGENGEPLELFLILPPNFADAVSRGKVMLYLEGKWRNGRAPLNSLPLDMPFALSEQDAALLDIFEKLNEGDTPAMLLLNPSQLAEVLATLAGHPRVTLGKAQEVEILSEPVRLVIHATLEPSGEIVLRRNGPAPKSIIGGAWIFENNVFQPVGLPPGLEALVNGPLQIPRARVPLFLSADWPALMAGCDVQANFVLEDFTLEPARPRFKLHLAGGLAGLQARLDCFYGDKPVASLQSETAWLPVPASPTHYQTRNLAAEQAALARLVRGGFRGPDAQGFFQLKGQDLVLNFFAREYPRLEKEWEVTLEERLERSTQKNFERLEPRVRITASGEQWFDLNVAYATPGGERFAQADIQRLLLSGQSHARLKNGKFALLDTGAVEELQEVLLDCAPDQHAGSYRLGNAQAGFLDATLRAKTNWPVEAPAVWTQRAGQQRGEVKLEPPPLGQLESVLRPYQKEGVAWLHFLRLNGFGGILADEMGLGKTLQVLALIQSLRFPRPSPVSGQSGSDSPRLDVSASSISLSASDLRIPHLVVCPTSLVFNWVAEAAKFTPALRVLALHGPQRGPWFAQIPAHDLVVTSYALFRRDAEQYRGLEFDTIILDEAQHIKNRQTQNAQAVKAMRSRHRLVLTGTPLENSVLDLWSIFDFLMPGYLGGAQEFRERYELAIVREQNAEAQNRLARRLRPFMLRRLKRDVAADLPEKLEQLSFCDLNEDQRGLYQQVLEASRREIVNAVDANGLAKSRMVVLTALLRLRQICCDVRLLKLEANSPGGSEPSGPDSNRSTGSAADGPALSGKLELFNELLEEVLDGGHRALVFSQFTSMLALLRDELSVRNIAFCYLDGSTRNRAEVVEKFQRDAGVAVFLISLKAGGVGLNLTGADTVIHFDPWWNPAVEAQATDRAHRIGQKKVVTSYKLITRGTVEEKILHLQTRKRALLQGMLGGEEQLAEALNWEEIQELLAG